MLCESCKKNEASVHYTQIIDGKMEERHLCEECASEDYNLDFENPFSMNKIFTGLIDNIQEDKKKRKELKCDNCGLSYRQFKKDGKFGCSNCYKTFKNNLYPLIEGLHGHNIHRGKIPQNVDEEIGLMREEEKLKRKLNDAVKKEEFEEAALLRDELKALKGKLNRYKEV